MIDDHLLLLLAQYYLPELIMMVLEIRIDFFVTLGQITDSLRLVAAIAALSFSQSWSSTARPAHLYCAFSPTLDLKTGDKC